MASFHMVVEYIHLSGQVSKISWPLKIRMVGFIETSIFYIHEYQM